MKEEQTEANTAVREITLNELKTKLAKYEMAISQIYWLYGYVSAPCKKGAEKEIIEKIKQLAEETIHYINAR